MTTDTLSKLYLELANVVPKATKSSRDIAFEAAIKRALRFLDDAARVRPIDPVNTYLAINELREALDLSPVGEGDQPSHGVR